jgi:hypothetical protein
MGDDILGVYQDTSGDSIQSPASMLFKRELYDWIT